VSWRKRLCVVLVAVAAGLLAAAPTGAIAQTAAAGRMTVLVSPVSTDKALQGLPGSYSDDALRREIEVALENTGYFTVASREKHDLDPVLKEYARAKKRPTAAFKMAKFVFNPTLEGFNLTERRRRTPNMRGKDTVTVQGSINMTIEVVNVSDGSVQSRIQIDSPYQTGARLLDPLPNDPLTRTDAYNGPPTPEELRGAYQDFGRVFAKRVLDQVYPAVVVQRSGDRVYISRGSDAGYQIGDNLRVIHRGGAIRHPLTQEIIGYDESTVGQVRVVETLPKMTIAEITSSSGQVAAGDIVREPPPPPVPRDVD